jgi:hypothetical protein
MKMILSHGIANDLSRAIGGTANAVKHFVVLEDNSLIDFVGRGSATHKARRSQWVDATLTQSLLVRVYEVDFVRGVNAFPEPRLPKNEGIQAAEV